MIYKRFEELPVWNDAVRLARQVYVLANTGGFRRFAGLRDQLQRVTLSVSNNIAEGFERETNEELLTFLYIAKGSAGEVRSMFHVIGGLEGWEDSSSEVKTLLDAVESISRQLGRWIESIKNTGNQGDRSRNDHARQTDRLVRGPKSSWNRLTTPVQSALNRCVLAIILLPFRPPPISTRPILEPPDAVSCTLSLLHLKSLCLLNLFAF